MFRIVFDEQGKGFMECQEPPVCESDVLECFPSDFQPSSENGLKLMELSGRTVSGRLLRIQYNYVSWTNEIVVYQAKDDCSPKAGKSVRKYPKKPVNLSFDED